MRRFQGKVLWPQTCRLQPGSWLLQAPDKRLSRCHSGLSSRHNAFFASPGPAEEHRGHVLQVAAG